MKTIEKAEKERHARNLRPTPEAKAAMFLWPDEYAKSGLGSMDFWDGLSERRKTYARDMVAAVTHQSACRIKELEGEVRHWKAGHDEMVRRNALLRDRPDLPMERTAAYERFISEREAALADNERLRKALEGMLEIVSESEGVAGYHLNGDVAAWNEFDALNLVREALKGEPHDA